MPKPNPLLAHTGQGSQSISIGYEDFVKGASTSDKFADQGFSPSSYNINLLSNVGEISSTPASTNTNNALQFIATCTNTDNTPVAITQNTVRAIDSTGRFWTCSSSNTWSDSGVQDSTHQFLAQLTDMVAFNGYYYTSSHRIVSSGIQGNVNRWDGATTQDTDWFHTNFSNYLLRNIPHPMLVFNKNLYIADGNMLHKYDGGSSYIYSHLTLDAQAVITALSIDPNSGRMMVAYAQVGRADLGMKPTKSNIGLYDGTNPTQFVKIVPMDDVVTCLYSIGGSVFIGYGFTLGIWNGAGVTFLRQLTISNGHPLYKQLITNIGNDLYFYDGANIMCYTEIQGLGKKVFFPLLKNSANAVMTALFNQDGLYILGYSNVTTGTGSLLYINVNTSGSQSQTALFKSNLYFFPRPVYLRAADILMDGVLTGSDTVTPVIIDDNGNSIVTDPTTISVNQTTQANRMNLGGIQTTSAQFQLTMNTSVPFKRVIIYYDLAE